MRMVDIVGVAHAVGQRVEVVDGGEHVVDDDVLRDEQVDVLTDRVLERLALELLEQAAQDDAADLAAYADLARSEIDEAGHVDHAVGEDLDVLAVHLERDGDDAGVVDGARLVAGEDLARVGEQLAGKGIGDGSGKLEAGDARVERELLVELVAADVGDVVTAVVEEQAVQQGLGGFHGGRIARTQAAVDLHQALVAALRGVLVEGGDQALVLAEDLLEALVGDGADGRVVDAAEPLGGVVLVVLTHGLEEPGDGQLAVLVDADGYGMTVAA